MGVLMIDRRAGIEKGTAEAWTGTGATRRGPSEDKTVPVVMEIVDTRVSAAGETASSVATAVTTINVAINGAITDTARGARVTTEVALVVFAVMTRGTSTEEDRARVVGALTEGAVIGTAAEADGRVGRLVEIVTRAATMDKRVVGRIATRGRQTAEVEMQARRLPAATQEVAIETQTSGLLISSPKSITWRLP